MEKMVNVFLFGKQYSVPADLTIMRAMEYAGYQLVRGCGCRNGFGAILWSFNGKCGLALVIELCLGNLNRPAWLLRLGLRRFECVSAIIIGYLHPA